MKISENELIIRFEADQNAVVVYRTIEGSSERVLMTRYSIEELQSQPVPDSARILGEDIIAALKGTRSSLL